MAFLEPLFVTVTWGAGGSTSVKSLELATTCQKDLKLTTCLHLTCTNMEKSIIDEALSKAKSVGIRNILALRGDPPRGEEYSNDNWDSDFAYAVDLVKYIKEKYGDWFCIGVAGYPEGHVDGADNSNQDMLKDIPYLVEKIEAGADFIITQMFYDSEKFLQFEMALANHSSGIFKNVPVIPGLMPINSYQSFVRASRLSNASIPKSILNKFTDDQLLNDNSIKDIGVEIITNIIDDINNNKSKLPLKKPQGFHFYTLNLEKSIALTVERSKILQKALDRARQSDKNVEDDDEEAIDETQDLPTDIHLRIKRKPRGSSVSNENKVILIPNNKTSEKNLQNNKSLFVPDSEEVGRRFSNTTRSVTLAISSGEGNLGRDANWDDFPNGRFGDSRSPAYGEIDGYGPSLKISNAEAYKFWGYPVTLSDINKVFINYLQQKINALPWSDLGLNPETALIQEELIQLNELGYWTVASQPATDGSKSTDRIFGWGPKGGYIYQKAFVEFFVKKDDWDKKIKPKIDNSSDSQNMIITYYYGDSRSDIINSNLPGESSNAVTWGVFPDREILQTTIVEKLSFKAWKEEAFTIWLEWAKLYARNTPSFKLLNEIYNNYYLVSIVHHDFKNESALWDILIESK